MLKMTVRPLAIRNSSMPNSTPFSVEMTISSSTALPAVGGEDILSTAFETIPVVRTGCCPIPSPFAGEVGPGASGVNAAVQIHQSDGRDARERVSLCSVRPVHLASGRQHGL